MYYVGSGIDYDISSHLAIALALRFSDTSSGISKNIFHSYGDGNIHMRHKLILASSIARQPALHVEITVVHFINIMNIMQRGM